VQYQYAKPGFIHIPKICWLNTFVLQYFIKLREVLMNVIEIFSILTGLIDLFFDGFYFIYDA
jgi:hypothetical protein